MTLDPTNHTDLPWLDLLAGDALLFGLLGKLLYTYPQEDWLSELVAEQVFAEAPVAMDQPDVQQGLARLQAWSQAYRAAPEATLRDLRADNTALFVGLGIPKAPPWGSFYLRPDQLLFQEETLQVRNWYRRFGLEAENVNQEPDDHIGLELAFTGHLAGLARQALEAGDERRAADLLAAQKEFLKEHLLVWAPLWCAAVWEHSRTDFYPGVAWLVQGALKEVATRLGFRVREAGG